MNTGKRNTARKVLCLVLAVLILGSLVSGALIMTVGAASSKEIEKELVALREEQAELKKQSDALQTSINENQAKTQTLVEKKADIDQQMEMSRQTIENLNEQIQQYSLLIAQKQDELEQTEAEEARLNKQYKTRLRASALRKRKGTVLDHAGQRSAERGAEHPAHPAVPGECGGLYHPAGRAVLHDALYPLLQGSGHGLS